MREHRDILVVEDDATLRGRVWAQGDLQVVGNASLLADAEGVVHALAPRVTEVTYRLPSQAKVMPKSLRPPSGRSEMTTSSRVRIVPLSGLIGNSRMDSSSTP
mgnify:CR=1 FL=1